MNNLPSISSFNRFSAIGSKILKALGGSPAGSEEDSYLKLVAKIYKVLAKIHDGIVDVTIDVAMAQTMKEAIRALERLQQMGMKDALKALKMCDKLEQLGRKMRALPWDKYGLTENEKADWDELRRSLEYREPGTARLYDDKLYDLRVLQHTESDLETLKAKVEEISNLLVVQKAQYERLAKLAKVMRESRSEV